MEKGTLKLEYHRAAKLPSGGISLRREKEKASIPGRNGGGGKKRFAIAAV
jgi:hypothetical protein